MKKRADGRYQLTETFEVNGVKKRKIFYGKTISEARQKRDDYLKRQDSSDLTLEDVVKLYEQVEEPRISPPAFQTKKERIHYFKSLFLVKLDTVSPQMIAIEINKLAIRNPKTKKPTAKRTLTRYLAALDNVFSFAISERLTQYNPCAYVRIPQNAPQIEREALLPVEYHLILNHTETVYLAAQIMILCGLRVGELTALTFADITDSISVTKSYNFKTKSIKLPKSKSGIRRVPLPEILKAPLQELKRTHKSSDYVISRGGNMMTESDWRYLRLDLIRELGFEFTWHQLRHTYATILYDAGVDVLSAQKFLGHSDIKVTLGVYTSLSEKRQKDSIASLDKFLA